MLRRICAQNCLRRMGHNLRTPSRLRLDWLLLTMVLKLFDDKCIIQEYLASRMTISQFRNTHSECDTDDALDSVIPTPEGHLFTL